MTTPAANPQVKHPAQVSIENKQESPAGTFPAIVQYLAQEWEIDSDLKFRMVGIDLEFEEKTSPATVDKFRGNLDACLALEYRSTTKPANSHKIIFLATTFMVELSSILSDALEKDLTLSVNAAIPMERGVDSAMDDVFFQAASLGALEITVSSDKEVDPEEAAIILKRVQALGLECYRDNGKIIEGLFYIKPSAVGNFLKEMGIITGKHLGKPLLAQEFHSKTVASSSSATDSVSVPGGEVHYGSPTATSDPRAANNLSSAGNTALQSSTQNTSATVVMYPK